MSASSSSGDNEVVAVVPKATTAVSSAGAMREPSPASHLRSDRNRERYFLNNTQRIVQDYFIGDACVRADGGNGKRCSEAEFERRFRMHRSLFNEVFVVVCLDPFFIEMPDATGKPGASALQKVVSAVRQMCYGLSADGVEEFTGLGESTSRESLKQFYNSVVEHFGKEYLRRPTEEDMRGIEAVYRSKGFPGCIGCLDCAGWEWEMSPVAQQGKHNGKDKRSEIRMDVICDESLWI